MKQIVIKIPDEFEKHFNRDRFEDSLARVASDIECFGFNLAGRYEQETITMLRKAIKNGTVLPDNHGRLIDADKLKIVNLGIGDYNIWGVEDCDINDAPTIIEADKTKCEEV